MNLIYNMENKTKIIILISLLLFQIPVLISSVYLHEQVHRLDFKDIPKTNEKICYGFDCGKNLLGYYKFNADMDYFDEAQQISKTTEYRAYGIQGLLLFSYLLIIVYCLKEFKNT